MNLLTKHHIVVTDEPRAMFQDHMALSRYSEIIVQICLVSLLVDLQTEYLRIVLFRIHYSKDLHISAH